MDVNAVTQAAVATLVAVGWKIAGAAALWLVGRWLISLPCALLGRALAQQQFDATLTRYLQTGLTVVLNVALVVAHPRLLRRRDHDVCGAARRRRRRHRRGVGRPARQLRGRRVPGVPASVQGRRLRHAPAASPARWKRSACSAPTINTPDNVHTIIGNNKIFSDTIQNFSANPYRRVDLTATISNAVDHQRRHPAPEGSGCRRSRTCWPRRRPTSTCCSSPRPARCSACGPTAATSTTGRCTSTRTG